MKRLLLVEDEPGLVLTLTDRLTREGYVVESTSDGESGSPAPPQKASICSFST